MAMKINLFILLALLMFSCNKENKKSPDVNIKELKMLAQEEVIAGFDIHRELSVNPLMDIPFSTYVKENEGQYSILYIPKTREIRDKYQDFDKKNSIQLSTEPDGTEYYSEESLRKINQIIREEMKIQDFCIIGRYIPYYCLQKDTTSTKPEYSVNIPYEMQIYKLISNEWELIESAKILDISGVGKYETLITYNDFLNIKY
jgi:hypothetical protein